MANSSWIAFSGGTIAVVVHDAADGGITHLNVLMIDARNDVLDVTFAWCGQYDFANTFGAQVAR